MELMCQTIHKINHLNLELKIEGLDDTTITIEGKYSINFTRSRGKFCLSLYHNGSNSFFICYCHKNISIHSKRL